MFSKEKLLFSLDYAYCQNILYTITGTSILQTVMSKVIGTESLSLLSFLTNIQMVTYD